MTTLKWSIKLTFCQNFLIPLTPYLIMRSQSLIWIGTKSFIYPKKRGIIQWRASNFTWNAKWLTMSSLTICQVGFLSLLVLPPSSFLQMTFRFVEIEILPSGKSWNQILYFISGKNGLACHTISYIGQFLQCNHKQLTKSRWTECSSSKIFFGIFNREWVSVFSQDLTQFSGFWILL